MDKISVVIPVYNEEKGLDMLLTRLVPVMEGMHREYEIVLVDDGSSDNSLEILKRHASRMIRIVELTRNYGQHAAIFAGFESCTGHIIITMDADLQNPPEEIPRLVTTMEEGNFEVVGTVRQARKDSIFRKIPSRVVNDWARKITGVNLSDWGVHAQGLQTGSRRSYGKKPGAFNLHPGTCHDICQKCHRNRGGPRGKVCR